MLSWPINQTDTVYIESLNSVFTPYRQCFSHVMADTVHVK